MKRKRNIKVWIGILLVSVMVLTSAFPVMAASSPIRMTWTVNKGKPQTYQFRLKTRNRVVIRARVLDPGSLSEKSTAMCGITLFNESKNRFETETFFFAKKKTKYDKAIILLPGTYTLDAECDTSCKLILQATPKPGLSAKKVTLSPGASKKLRTYGVTGKVKWKSSKKRIATVNSQGKVVAKRRGTCVITAKTADGRKFKCKVTVQ